jgi:DNA-binding winged helix-turn-helix (wHTH) protein/tetratricopeptide (TPR) repeat protein
MSKDSPGSMSSIRFGRFCIDRNARELLKDGQPLEIEPKTLELLELLASQPGHTFSKDQIAETIWPGRVISDSVISQAVRKIRKVTEDSASKPRVIKTIHGVGYRFVADLESEARAPGRPRYQRWQLGLLGMLALVLAFGISFNLDRPAGEGPISVQAALLPFVNATGDEQLDWTVAGLPGLLAAGLNNQARINIVDSEQVQQLQANFSDADSTDEALTDRIRALLGANILISGEIQGQAENWELVLRIDPANGETIEQRIAGPNLTDLITRQGYQTVQLAIDSNDPAGPAPFSPDAFVNETFARGLASEQTGDNLSARDLFAVVTRLDADFLPGWLALARVQQFMGELEQSAATAAALHERIGATQPAPRVLVELYQIEGLVAFARGENEKAREHLTQALTLATEHQMGLARAGLLRNLGTVASREGAYEMAENHYAQALAIFDRENYEPGRARVFNSLGTLAWRRDMIDESEQWHRRALVAFQRLGARDLVNISLSNLAVIAANRGQIEQSVELNQRVLAHHQVTGNRESEILVLGNLARGLTQLNQLSSAKSAANEMLDRASELGLTSQSAYARLQLGLINLRMHKTAQALDHFEQAHRSYLELADQPYLLSATAHLIRAHLLNQDTDSARALHARWAAQLDQASSPGVQSQVLWVRAMLAIAEGELDGGIRQLEQARALARQSGQIEAANTYATELAELLLRVGRVDEAEQLLA